MGDFVLNTLFRLKLNKNNLYLCKSIKNEALKRSYSTLIKSRFTTAQDQSAPEKTVILTKQSLRRLALFFALLATSVLSLFIGVADLSINDILNADTDKLFILSVSRFPRTISLVLAGIGLSVSGLIMQHLTRNKFVSPTTAGSLEAAQLGLLLGFIFFPLAGMVLNTFLAFAVTFIASLIFLKIVDSIRVRNIIFVPLVGLMFGGILHSGATFLAVNYNIVQDMNAWMMGDFSGILAGRYELIYLSLPAIIVTYLYANQFTVVGMGEDFSKNLGLNYPVVMGLGLFCVSLTISVVVITAGFIPFLGLVVPNIVTMIYGDNIKKILPEVALSGALFLVVCDIIGRLVIYPFEIPIGLTVGIIGGIIFLILLLRRK